jgi:hypothetical protein
VARLRLPWIESRAINQIKNVVVINHDPDLASLFRRRMDAMHPAYNPQSFGFILAQMAALLSGLAIGSAVAVFRLSNEPNSVP